jgi:sensor c-di-GMP phosphodiesterase-like protein
MNLGRRSIPEALMRAVGVVELEVVFQPILDIVWAWA